MPRFTAEGWLKMLKFLENAGISAGYLVESIHGAGSPEAGGYIHGKAALHDFQLAEDMAKNLARIKVNIRLPKDAEPRRGFNAEGRSRIYLRSSSL